MKTGKIPNSVGFSNTSGKVRQPKGGYINGETYKDEHGRTFVQTPFGKIY